MFQMHCKKFVILFFVIELNDETPETFNNDNNESSWFINVLKTTKI